MKAASNVNDVILGLLKNPFKLVTDVNVRELVASSHALTPSSSVRNDSSYDDAANPGKVVVRHSSRVVSWRL